MADTVRDLKRRRIEEHLKLLAEQYKAVGDELSTSLDPATGVRLRRRLEQIEQEMATAEAELQQLTAPAATPADPTPAAPDRTAVRDALVSLFSAGELQTLCFDMGIDYENLPGGGKADKARELVAFCERRGRLAELAAVIRRERPGTRV